MKESKFCIGVFTMRLLAVVYALIALRGMWVVYTCQPTSGDLEPTIGRLLAIVVFMGAAYMFLLISNKIKSN